MTKNTTSVQGAKTNKEKSSLVKVVVPEAPDDWKSPKENEVFKISEDGKFPDINFELDLSGETTCDWTWEITWAASTSGMRESKKRGRTLKKWSDSGKVKDLGKLWKADLNGKCLGGVLKVTVSNNGKKFRRHVRVIGTNPTEKAVSDFIATFNEISGFEKLVKKESAFKQFINADGEPIVAFDGGYGLTQLTNPPPKYQEAWGWKENIKAGIKLYKEKMQAARKYLEGSKRDRTFTNEQLELETWCRWNSGNYHEWDKTNNRWIRDPTILNDTNTGNIGWDITKSENKGQSEESLHERDKSEYSKPPTSTSLWRYSGVVYADNVKNN